jgi:hypothetical protein
MNRAKTLMAMMAVILALLLAPTARAADSIDDDTRYVADPHTGPAAKLSAMHRLAERGAEARRAVPALLRPTTRGTQVVRDAARQALVQVAGSEEAARLLADLNPAGGDALSVLRKRWLDGKVTWAATDELRQLIGGNVDRATELAADTVLKLVKTDPRGAAALGGNARRDLLAGVSRAATGAPKRHADFLDAVDLLGAANAPAEAVHLLLRIAAANAPGGPDAEMGNRARRLLATTLDAETRCPSAIPGLVAGLADADPKVAALADTLAPRDAAVRIQSALADEIARRAELGDLDPLPLLKRHDVDPATFAYAVRRRFEANEADTPRLHLLRALQRAGAAPAVAQTQGLHALVVQCLGRPAVLAEQAARAQRLNRAGDRVAAPAPIDLTTADALADAAREVLLAGDTPHTAEQTLATAIGQGQALTPALVRAFKPDRRELADLLQPHLTQGPPAVRLSAAKMLAVVGVPADAADTRAALDALLRSTDPDLRRAAADALDTPAARDLVRIPDLLRDLAADAPGARQVAARQIQSLAVDSPEIAALLVRATDQGDMATREGLRLALERSFATARPAKEVLAELAAATNRDATTRAYARAALRQLPP